MVPLACVFNPSTSALLASLLWLGGVFGPAAAARAPVIEHRIQARVEPETGLLRVTDRVSLPTPVTQVEFVLHPELSVTHEGPGRLIATEGSGPARYRVSFEGPRRALTLSYAGVIRHPLGSHRGDGAKTDAATPGLIGEEGVFLGPGGGWYPDFDGTAVTFSLDVDLPDG